MTIDIGDVRRLKAVFKNISGTVTDPTGITLTMREPDGTVTTFTYGTDVELVKDSTGTYYVDWPITQSGIHKYRWAGTGTVIVAEEGLFTVQRRRA